MSTTWTTYRRADGKLIQGEWAWVDDPEMLDAYDPVEIIAEEWELRESYTYDPTGWWEEDEED